MCWPRLISLTQRFGCGCLRRWWRDESLRRSSTTIMWTSNTCRESSSPKVWLVSQSIGDIKLVVRVEGTYFLGFFFSFHTLIKMKYFLRVQFFGVNILWLWKYIFEIWFFKPSARQKAKTRKGDACRKQKSKKNVYLNIKVELVVTCSCYYMYQYFKISWENLFNDLYLSLPNMHYMFAISGQ